jgi:hypothetical protein
VSALDGFWAGYDATLARIRMNRPATVDALVVILNAFQAPSSGLAFFGNNADEHLSDALADAGWDVRYIEGDYLWEAQHQGSGEWVHYVEGDVYAGRYGLFGKVSL